MEQIQSFYLIKDIEQGKDKIIWEGEVTIKSMGSFCLGKELWKDMRAMYKIVGSTRDWIQRNYSLSKYWNLGYNKSMNCSYDFFKKFPSKYGVEMCLRNRRCSRDSGIVFFKRLIKSKWPQRELIYKDLLYCFLTMASVLNSKK